MLWGRRGRCVAAVRACGGGFERDDGIRTRARNSEMLRRGKRLCMRTKRRLAHAVVFLGGLGRV